MEDSAEKKRLRIGKEVKKISAPEVPRFCCEKVAKKKERHGWIGRFLSWMRRCLCFAC